MTSPATDRAAFIAWLRSHDACASAVVWIEQHPDLTPEQLWEQHDDVGNLLWLVERVGTDPTVFVRLALRFAQDVIHLVPDDETRPREALAVVGRWLDGTATDEEVTTAGNAAWDTAGNAAGNAARPAAGAAAWAAWTAVALDAAWAAARAVVEAAWTAAGAEGAATARAAAWAAARRRYADWVREAIPWADIAAGLEAKA